MQRRWVSFDGREKQNSRTKWFVWKRWITGGKIRMILIIEFIVLSVVYISMAVIMKYNNISLKTKSYWFVMILAVFLYMFGFVIGKYYTG